MTCMIYKWLFRIIPLKTWQVFLIKSHFRDCPVCGQKVEQIDGIRAAFFSARNFRLQPDLWPAIKKEVEQPADALKKNLIQMKRFPILRWQWIATSLVVIGMAVLIPGLLSRKSVETRKSVIAENIVVKSIKFNNRPAKTYFYQTGNSKRLIIWVQKSN